MPFFNEYTFIFIAGWILPSALLGLLGDSRIIGFWKSIIISLLLSPLLGLVIVLSSKTRQTDKLEKELLDYLKDQKSNRLSEELGKINALYAKGIITKEEFEIAKKTTLKIN